MAYGVYQITADFEDEICKYTGAPYCVAVDCCAHALFLSLKRVGVAGMTISIPSRTFPSVPCEIIHAGAKVHFRPVDGKTICGTYQLAPTCVWDSALRFTSNMYVPGTFTCISFTGPRKTFKLSRGGAILTDDKDSYEWFKRARMSGRREGVSSNEAPDMIGWSYYMMPELAARGLLMIPSLYDFDGTPLNIPDLELEYPDLSVSQAYK